MALDFGLLESNLFPQSNVSGDGLGADLASQIVWNDVGVGIVPIGGLVPWVKSGAGTPPLLPNYKECDGTAYPSESPMTGNIPDLNGNNNFLRGNGTSGGTGGADTHAHGIARLTKATTSGPTFFVNTNTTVAGSTLPAYFEIVWVMRVF